MDWTAEVKIGQSTASVPGSGAASVVDLISIAIGISAIELVSVILGLEPDHLMVGFRTGDKSGPLMLAGIVVERSAS